MHAFDEEVVQVAHLGVAALGERVGHVGARVLAQSRAAALRVLAEHLAERLPTLLKTVLVNLVASLARLNQPVNDVCRHPSGRRVILPPAPAAVLMLVCVETPQS